MKPADRIDLVRKLDLLEGGRAQMLVDLGIPRSTFYHWRSEYDQKKEAAFIKRPSQRRVWNKLESNETERVLDIALENPELSPRLLAVKITDEEIFSVSESTVYRILKQRGLIYSRPLPEMPAAKEWKKKTTRPDELWQCDGTNLFIVGWGYYKLIPVEDDYSRKILGFDLKPDESGFSISDVMEIAIEEARKEGHVLDPMPTLYADNGPGFASDILTGYLAQHEIRHIFGTPYHPQGRGKIERFNRSIKEKLCLVVYTSPSELMQAIKESIRIYNQTPHESLKNVCPNNVYAGRKEEVLQKRQEKKRLTLERRKSYNLNQQNNGPDQERSANLDLTEVSKIG
jgi:transposase InsO family protein